MTDKPIRMLALDLDGTTLQSDGTLSAGNRRALEEAVRRGIYVVIATGRTLQAIPAIMREFPGVRYAITSNGAAVADMREGRWIYKNEMGPEAVGILLDRLEGSDLMIESFVNGQAYVDEKWYVRIADYGFPEGYIRYALRTRQPIPDMFGFLRRQNGVENVNVNFSDLKQRLQWKKKLWDIPGTEMTSSFPHNWEIGGEGVGKGDGLGALCRHLNLLPEEVLAAGDNENDISMIRFAGCGVAMGNALNTVKEEADYVTGPCWEDGLADAIWKFALGGRLEK